MDEQTALELDTIFSRNSRKYAEDAFLSRKLGKVHTGLHRLFESPKESLFHWTQPGNVGNTGGGSPKPHGTHYWSPGDPALFDCAGISGQEDNFYFYCPLPMPTTLPSRVVDFRTHQITDFSQWQALEWQQQLTLGRKIYNMAWQFSASSGIRIYDKANEKWIPSGIDPKASPDFTKPVSTRCEFSLNQNAVTHVSITIEQGNVSASYAVGITQLAPSTNGRDKLTLALQVDPKKGASCSLQIADIELRYI